MLQAVKGALVLAVATVVTAFLPAQLGSGVTPMQQMFIMKEIMPDVERLGIIWDKETRDEEVLTKIRRAGTSLKVQLFLAEVSALSEIPPQSGCTRARREARRGPQPETRTRGFPRGQFRSRPPRSPP